MNSFLKMKNILTLSAIFYFLFVVTALFIGRIDYIAIQLFYFFILFIISKMIFNRNDFCAKNYTVLGYTYLSFVAILLIWHHNTVYGWDFDIWGDDKRFFEYAQYYKTNLLEPSYSGYEKLLAIILLFFNLFHIKDSVLLLLPLNWLIASLTIGLSYKLSLKITHVRLPFVLFFLSIFLNYTFVQNSVHLYRDVYVAFFSILAILYVEKFSYLKAGLFSVLSGFFRFPNAVFNFIVVGIKLYFSKNKKLFIVLLLSFSAIAFYAVKANIKISKYEMSLIFEMLEKRNQNFISELEGGIGILYKLPEPVRFIVNVPFQVVRPITIKNAFINNFDHRKFGNAITTLTLIVLIGYYMKGLLIGFMAKNNSFRFFFFVIVLYAVIIGYFSFLDRNRIIMIPLFPTLIALNFSKYTLSRRAKIILYYANKKIFSIAMLAIILALS